MIGGIKPTPAKGEEAHAGGAGSTSSERKKLDAGSDGGKANEAAQDKLLVQPNELEKLATSAGAVYSYSQTRASVPTGVALLKKFRAVLFGMPVLRGRACTPGVRAHTRVHLVCARTRFGTFGSSDGRLYLSVRWGMLLGCIAGARAV